MSHMVQLFYSTSQLRGSLATLAYNHLEPLSRNNRYAEILIPRKLQFQETNENKRILEDFKDIHETITKVGPPELADRISGSYLSASIYEDSTSKTLRISESLNLFSDNELDGILGLLAGDWPQDSSDALRTFVQKLDEECLKRNVLCVHRALSLSRLMSKFFFDHSKYSSLLTKVLLENASALELKGSPSHVVTLLILAAFSSPMKTPNSKGLEKLVFDHDLDAQELSICLLGIRSMDPSYRPTALESKLRSEHGFVL